MFLIVFSSLITLIAVVFLILVKRQISLAVRLYNWLEDKLSIFVKMCLVALCIPVLNVAFILISLVVTLVLIVLDQVFKIEGK